MKQIFDELKARITVLDTSPIEFSEATEDGRVNSALDEKTVFDFLHKYIPELEEAPPRHWYDCMYKGYPFNIKITKGNNPDNMSSKEGFMYALTGKTYPELSNYGNLNFWINFNKALVENIQPNELDYGFIVLFKDTKEIILSSVKQLQIVVANGSNLPLQIRWNDNKVPTTRSEIEQINYLMGIYISAWHKKCVGLEPLDDWRELK